MTAKPYQREPNGQRLAFHGINTVKPPDALPPGKYPYAQNVRGYLHDRVKGRATLDSSAMTLPFAVHTIRRLNDSTPAGPAGGYILVEGASVFLYANATQVDSGLSGNPISLVPFRPNASVQPWMYVGDSLKMDKVRSDGTRYKMGIMEPQVAPAVSSIPASTVVSLLGAVNVSVWGDSPHGSPVATYIWKNANDPSGTGPVRTATPANITTAGNSLLFDSGLNVNGSVPVEWTQFTANVGTVDTNGTAITWVSGSQFGDLTAGNKIVISGITYTLVGAVTSTTATVTVSAGVQTGASYTAAAILGAVPLFQPALESQGYQDFNACITATLYIPTPGTYTFAVVVKDDMIWGIGNNATGTATWAGPTGGQVLSVSGQTKTVLNGYPLMPLTRESSGGDGFTSNASVAVTFSQAGNYPIEIDWDYWYHNGRTLTVKCNGADIPPLPSTVITQAQYRYVYRSSATGAVSNPSPESAESGLSVLSNNVTLTGSTDPQVDKIDIYRLDIGLLNFTYVGTVSNGTALTTFVFPVPIGLQTVAVQSIDGMFIGQVLIVGTGGSAEAVTIAGLRAAVYPPPRFFPPSFTATFTKTHNIGDPIFALSIGFNDTLLDSQVLANPILQFDNFEPFPSIDIPKSGMVNVQSGVVTWVSGNQFNPRWLPGTIIVIGTVAYTLDKRPTSPVTLTATNVQIVGGIAVVQVPPDASNTSYAIAEPDLAAQPVPYLWGPTDNVAFFFGVGDPLRPGTLYWSKGNNPDSAPDTNQQDVTSPSEPLMNGVITNGIGLVMSTERGFLIYPNFFNALATVQGTVGSTWTIQESISTRGLYMPRAICVDGGGNVFFRAKDGIYISPGGQGAKSITDEDLYNIFPHEGMIPESVTVGGFTVYPPDDTKPQAQKMNVANGYVYYDYLDATSTARTLVYDIAAKGWVPDVYQFPVSVHVLEEGAGINGVLCGCFDGTIRPMVDSGVENAISVVLMPSFNAGDSRAPKHFGDLWIEAEQG
jgi:hypothetical protein